MDFRNFEFIFRWIESWEVESLGKLLIIKFDNGFGWEKEGRRGLKSDNKNRLDRFFVGFNEIKEWFECNFRREFVEKIGGGF